MATRAKLHPTQVAALEKAPTGIKGLDDITEGGLPRARTTIVCGGPGCGKTMLGIEFLVRGAIEFDEPGVLIAFEESSEDIAKNVSSLGFDLKDLVARKKLLLDYVPLDPSEIHETGDYNLEGLFLRLQTTVESVGAKRIVLDTLEALFSTFSNQAILRAEFRRLFTWLNDQGLTSVVTAERGETTLTREGLEEYVSDCLILLDHRMQEQISSRRLRIVKYRGTKHGADEYPFLIDEQGISILPLTSIQLQHKVSSERVSSGVPAMDEMLDGKGYFRGSTILISGTAGSGKTTLSASFAAATCERGERCLYIGMEESGDQLARNMRSVNIDLERWIKKGLLSHEAWRPTQFGLEMHLLRIHKLVDKLKPQSIVIDPITNLIGGPNSREVESMLMRLMDFLKGAHITTMMVSLTEGGQSLETTRIGVSSLADTWVLLRDIELNAERNRCMYILKSRGMAHSNQLREFILTDKGIELVPAYIASAGVLTGSSRVAQEAREKAEALDRELGMRRRQEEMTRKRLVLQAQMEALKAELAAEEQAMEENSREYETRRLQGETVRKKMAKSRRA
jgi:circadian clock protein KaiC